MSLQGFLGRLACKRLGQDMLQDLAAQTAGLVPRDVAGMVADSAAAAIMQVMAGAKALLSLSFLTVMCQAGTSRIVFLPGCEL